MNCLTWNTPITLLLRGTFVTGFVTKIADVDPRALGEREPPPTDNMVGKIAAATRRNWIQVLESREIDGYNGMNPLEYLNLRDVHVRLNSQIGPPIKMPSMRVRVTSVDAWFVGDLT